MRHYDLAVIGTGSGNSVVTTQLADRRVAILERGVFGGTCLNVGCIPTKMFVHTADLAHAPASAGELGVDLTLDGVRWGDVRDRIFRRIDPISVSGRNYRAERLENVDLYEGHARFVGDRTLDTGAGATITADQVVIAAGSRVDVPDVPGLDRVPYETSDTVMRLDERPRRLLILGGGFVAAEFAHVFGSFGTDVTIVTRGEELLRSQDEEVSARFTGLASKRWDVRLRTVATGVERYDGGVRMHVDGPEGPGTVEADVLLVATGRISNADGLDCDRTGVALDEDGRVVVDEHQHTTADGIWALGDVSNRWQLKHVSNHEARVVQHNLLHLDDPSAWRRASHAHVPSAVFTSPQVAGVGLTEQAARDRGIAYVTAKQMYGDTAYGWAMEDTTSFCKLLAEPGTGLLLGAHLMGPHASSLIQPLIHAMAFGQTAQEVARGQYWIHPALSEVVENALLGIAVTEPSTATPG